MSTNWSQRDTRRKTIPEFVEKARALRPVLRHRSVAPVSARYQGELLTPGELAGRGLGRGDTVVLDYGDHHVGFITLTLKEEGGPADAPADPMALLEEWRALLGVGVLPDWEETQTVQAGATELRSVQGRLRLQVCAAHETFLLEAASFS